MKKTILTLLLLMSSAWAQEALTLEEAIRLGLKNNYDIRIARNDAKVSENNRGLGMAGFLPTVDATGNYNLADYDEDSNSSSSLDEYDTENLSADVTLNWTIFDGFKMFTEKKKYDELSRLGRYQSRQQIENTVVAISRAYFDLVQQEQLLAVARETKDISNARLEKERVGREIGGSSSTDYLNAKVAYNNDQSSLLDRELAVTVAREELNLLLGQYPATPLVVSNEINIPSLDMSLDEIQQAALEQNSGLKTAELNKDVADRGVQSARSSFLPRLNLNAGYGYSDFTQSADALSEDISTQTTSASVGLNLSFNLFNGTRDKISYQNARLEAWNQKLALRDAQNRLAGTVRQTYETFVKRQEKMQLEEENVEAARQNMELQQDFYRLGGSSSLEFRDAQVSLSQAQISLIVARYEARITRLELDQLTGNIAVE